MSLSPVKQEGSELPYQKYTTFVLLTIPEVTLPPSRRYFHLASFLPPIIIIFSFSGTLILSIQLYSRSILFSILQIPLLSPHYHILLAVLLLDLALYLRWHLTKWPFVLFRYLPDVLHILPPWLITVSYQLELVFFNLRIILTLYYRSTPYNFPWNQINFCIKVRYLLTIFAWLRCLQ